MSDFGPIIDYARVENAIRDNVLRPWMDTYLVATERENDIRVRSIIRPRDWKVQDDLTVTPEKNLPVLYVVSGGEIGEPQDDGEGKLWSLITIAAVVALKDTTRDTTRVTTRRYAAAVATLIEHKLGEVGLGVRLASKPRQAFDEDVSQPSGASSRFIFGLAYVEFTAQVEVVRYSRGGPDEPFPEPEKPRDPDAPPNPHDPDHLSTHVTIGAVGIGDPIVVPAINDPGDPAGKNVSVLFTMPTALVGESSPYTVRSRTFIRRAVLACTTGPVGGPLTVQVLVNGTPVETLTIPAGSNTAQSVLLSVPVALGDELAVAATSVGTTPALGVTCQVDLGG